MGGWVTNWGGTHMNPEHAPTPKNSPELMKLTRVRVLRPFCVGGKPLAIEEIVRIEYHVARDLAVIGKARIVEPAC
jgi:hypothetical protein